MTELLHGIRFTRDDVDASTLARFPDDPVRNFGGAGPWSLRRILAEGFEHSLQIQRLHQGRPSQESPVFLIDLSDNPVPNVAGKGFPLRGKSLFLFGIG